jgi:hypothetical protein
MVAKNKNDVMPKTPILSKTENHFMADISAILEVGKRSVEQEQQGKERANYGDFLIRNLSIYLGQAFDRGFSLAYLKNIRQFYLAFQNDQKGCTLCSQLSWSHIRLVMRLGNEKARHYYLAETREWNWSVRVLERNIRSGYYERLLSIQKKTVTKTMKTRDNKTDDLIKDTYILEFLGIPEYPAEKESLYARYLRDGSGDE